MTPFGKTRGFAVLVLAFVATLATTGCADDTDAPEAPGARLVTVIGRYNVVKFGGYVYGVPHGVAVDWQKDDLKKVPGMIVGTSVDNVEKTIRSLPVQNEKSAAPLVTAAPEATLVTTIGRYNIVKFKDHVYGVPHGVAVDWQKDDPTKVDGMVVDTSVDNVKKTVRSLPVQNEKSATPPVTAAPEATLVTTIGRYNIVKFKDHVYGVPHGVAVDWQKDDPTKVDGMVVGSSVVLVEISVIGRQVGKKVSRLIGGK